jgi:putative SOS response-associated peptidase YedK
MMQWGLIPSWAKDPKIGAKLINARAETLHERPAFRTPLKSRRCLVPATGFYEWKKTAIARIPYYIHRRDNALFAFAGLYDAWRAPGTTENLLTFTIITTEPNALVATIHNRMPAIVKQKHEALWLQHKPLALEEIREILNPYPPDQLEAYRVSNAVNNPKLDSEEFTRPLSKIM